MLQSARLFPGHHPHGPCRGVRGQRRMRAAEAPNSTRNITTCAAASPSGGSSSSPSAGGSSSGGWEPVQRALATLRSCAGGALLTAALVAGATLGGPTGASQAVTNEQLLYLEAWRAVDRAYVDKSFNGQSWFRVGAINARTALFFC